MGVGEGADSGLGVDLNDIVDDLGFRGKATLSLVLAFCDRLSKGSVLDSSDYLGIAVAQG